MGLEHSRKEQAKAFPHLLCWKFGYLLPVSNGTGGPMVVPRCSIRLFSSLAEKY